MVQIAYQMGISQAAYYCYFVQNFILRILRSSQCFQWKLSFLFRDIDVLSLNNFVCTVLHLQMLKALLPVEVIYLETYE